MRALHRSTILVTAALLGWGAFERGAMAGPWVDDQPGHGFVSLGYSRYQADDYYTGPGETKGPTVLPEGHKQHIIIPIGSSFLVENFNTTYLDQSMQFYGEVSLGHRFGFVATLPVVRYVSETVALAVPDTLTQLNVGDLNVGLKYQIPHIHGLRGFDFGPQLYFTAPTGDVNGRGAYSATALKQFPNTPALPLPTGNGVADMEFRGSFGYSFYPIPMFIAADVGVRHRLDAAVCSDKGVKTSVNYSDDLPYAVQLGGTYTAGKKGFDHLTVTANLTGVHSFENGDVPGRNGAPTKGPLFAQPCGQANNQSAVNFGGSIMVFFIKNFGVTYTVAHTLWGINTGYGLVNTAGVAAQF